MKIAPLLAALAIAAAGAASAQPAPSEDAAQALVAHAAADFRQHMQPPPVDFRRVRLGQLAATDGQPRQLLCGEFRLAGAKAAWTPFATIKTDPYEQWIGGAATGYCRPPAFKATSTKDFAGVLKQSLAVAAPASAVSTHPAR